ncbi:MAG: hypothetical protein QUU85_08250, partial [Candidatus Eisenbacteria bacterium]|nr:hypothetical protein [Candidatus Eisenbacteria bacterium]
MICHAGARKPSTFRPVSTNARYCSHTPGGADIVTVRPSGSASGTSGRVARTCRFSSRTPQAFARSIQAQTSAPSASSIGAIASAWCLVISPAANVRASSGHFSSTRCSCTSSWTLRSLIGAWRSTIVARSRCPVAVSYTHLTLPTSSERCRS